MTKKQTCCDIALCQPEKPVTLKPRGEPKRLQDEILPWFNREVAKSRAAYSWKRHRPAEQDAAPIALHVAGVEESSQRPPRGAETPPARGGKKGELAVGWYGHRDAITQGLTYIAIS